MINIGVSKSTISRFDSAYIQKVAHSDLYRIVEFFAFLNVVYFAGFSFTSFQFFNILGNALFVLFCFFSIVYIFAKRIVFRFSRDLILFLLFVGISLVSLSWSDYIEMSLVRIRTVALLSIFLFLCFL